MHAIYICNERSSSCIFHALQLIKRSRAASFFSSFFCLLFYVFWTIFCLISSYFIVLSVDGELIAPLPLCVVIVRVLFTLWFSAADNWQLFSNHEMIK